jgi:hypothetical protein
VGVLAATVFAAESVVAFFLGSLSDSELDESEEEEESALRFTPCFCALALFATGLAGVVLALSSSLELSLLEEDAACFFCALGVAALGVAAGFFGASSSEEESELELLLSLDFLAGVDLAGVLGLEAGFAFDFVSSSELESSELELLSWIVFMPVGFTAGELILEAVAGFDLVSSSELESSELELLSFFALAAGVGLDGVLGLEAGLALVSSSELEESSLLELLSFLAFATGDFPAAAFATEVVGLDAGFLLSSSELLSLELELKSFFFTAFLSGGIFTTSLLFWDLFLLSSSLELDDESLEELSACFLAAAAGAFAAGDFA